MKIFVKTLKGSQFDIEVKPEDSVADVKKHIENARGGADVYPAAHQILIHQGQVLKDDTTLDENKVVESSFVVIMLTKSKSSSGEGSGAPTATTTKAPQTSVISEAPTATSMPRQVTRVILPPPGSNARAIVIPHSESDPHAQAASDLVAGTNLEGTIQQILEMGGGTWDRDTVVRALCAAFNNPERAIDYLYSGIPEELEAPRAARIPVSGGAANFPAQPLQSVQPVSNPPNGPNANPLNLFPQGLPNLGAAPAASTAGAGNLNFLRENPRFQELRTMVQSNPQILQPIIQELGKQNPNLRNLIQQHQADFIRLINEPVEGVEGVEGEENLLEELAAAMPQSVSVTPEEHEAIERLEAMGFERQHVLEVFIACNKNEELAANFLLDHMHED